MIACGACDREYRVPPLPQTAKSEPVTTSPENGQIRLSSRQRQARFNLIVTGIATATVVLSVVGMLWLRSENQVHGDTSGRGTSPVEVAAADAERTWDAENLLADFAPIQTDDLEQFVGTYSVLGTLTAGKKRVFGSPRDENIVPATLEITRHRHSTETLFLHFADASGRQDWNETLVPTSVRLGHGFNLVANFRPALKVLGAYSVEDFTDHGVHCSVNSHRYLDGKIVVTHACLNADEFEKKVPLREREHLCRVVSTYSLSGDTLTITRRASGSNRELTRRFVSLLNAQTIDSRQLDAGDLTAFEQSWLEGQTLVLKRKSAAN